jgi:hypothetical protein
MFSLSKGYRFQNDDLVFGSYKQVWNKGLIIFDSIDNSLAAKLQELSFQRQTIINGIKND